MADYNGVWPAGGLLFDGGKIWRNTSGVPLITPPSGFPGTPSQWRHLFVEVTTSAPDEWPPWVQPTGAHDAYPKDARVTHSGRHWASLVDANVWEPPTQWADMGPA